MRSVNTVNECGAGRLVKMVEHVFRAFTYVKVTIGNNSVEILCYNDMIYDIMLLHPKFYLSKSTRLLVPKILSNNFYYTCVLLYVCCLVTIPLNIAEGLHCLAEELLFVINKLLVAVFLL